MAGTVVADTLQAAATSTLLIQTGNGAPTTAISVDPTQKVTLPVGIDGDLKFNSGYGSIATAYGCRAWVNFNGTTNVGGFCTIRASGNVSSVTDRGVGKYTVNFATALPDGNYSTVVTCAFDDGGGSLAGVQIEATGATPFKYDVDGVGLLGQISTGTNTDFPYVCVSIFR
jgi:hypothetical protein